MLGRKTKEINMSQSSKFLCVILSLFCLYGNIEATECVNSLHKPKYKVLYDEIDYFLDARVVLVMDKTTRHYCVYLIGCCLNVDKLEMQDILAHGEPVSFEVACKLINLEKLGINLYGF